MPSVPFEIRKIDKDDFAMFYDNITASSDINGMTGQSISIWNYDQYILPITNSSNIYASIESNFDEWLQRAKDYELDQESEKIRIYRDKLLNDCDVIYCASDKWEAMTSQEKLDWNIYKQSLRDIPNQIGFPYSINFPVIPIVKNNSLSDKLNQETQNQSDTANFMLDLDYRATLLENGVKESDLV